MSFHQPNINPYAPTSAVEPASAVEASAWKAPDPNLDDSKSTLSLRRTAIRWLLVCGISAMPSFLIGLAITNSQVMGMITGILIFASAYTLLDYRTALWPIRLKKTVRRTLRIAYGTRIAISILFPIGAYLDLVCGVVSVGLTQSITGSEFRTADPMSFSMALLTTLVQGLVLNAVLAFYALLVHLVQLVVLAMRR